LLKKADLNAADVKSYRPITNLSVLFKLLERLDAQQLTEYLTENGLLPELQSAYRTHHSTETAMLKIMGNILLALDSGNLAMLSFLDLSAAFDTVDHDTLLRRLQTFYGLDGIVIKWFISYLSGRPVRANTDHHVVPIACGAWSPSRIGLGADPLPAVRRRPAEADQTSPVGPPCLCRRHSNLRFLSAELCQPLS